MDQVLIFDTTLRDGEQSPGATLNVEEKVEIAHQLNRLGVDVIEAGFPYSSPGDFEAVTRVAKEVKGPIIAGLAHAHAKAIDACWEAVKHAERPRVHVFLSSSDVHLMYQLKKNHEEILELATEMVARAAKHLSDVEFSPMDATRTNREYLYRILESVIDAGATTVNIPDTVGYTTPEEFYDLIKSIFEKVPNIHKATVSIHCHNDLGLSVANSIAAVRAGARQVECTINGIGERAGNASLEEIVMAIRTRNDLYDIATNIDSTQIYKTSRLVSDLTGMSVQPNKAIVGANAFRHESGIHQDGILKNPITYEIMTPTSVGVPKTTLYLGKLSGRHALKDRLEDLGYSLTDEELKKTFQAFKEVADKKKEVTDRDLEALMGEERRTHHETYHLEHVQVACGDHEVPTATVTLKGPDGEITTDAAVGTGPVDAVYKAINRIVDVPNHLTEFSIKSVTEGIDALGEVTIRVESNDQTYMGRGAHTDIIVASARAYMNALNRLLAARSAEVEKVTVSSG
ncbi:MAG: 2-isopropylmalate synthase [Chloroflexi bacterium]|nr:2-isopropylmalate synthase [Chloroflexota bacterium]